MLVDVAYSCGWHHLLEASEVLICSDCGAAMVKVAGTINKSTEVMKIVNDLVQVGSMQSGMREMARGICLSSVVYV